MGSFLRLLGLESAGRVHSVAEQQWQLTEPLSQEAALGLLLLGVVLAGVNLLPMIRMRPRVRIYTFLLRAGMVLLLFAVVQKTEVHLLLNLEERQHWLALVDDSASMGTADAAGQPRFSAALTDLKKVSQAADDNVAVEVRSFSGGKLGEAAGQGPTLIQRTVVRNALARADLDRLILLTDGRDVEGRDFTRLGDDLRARGISVDIRLYGSDIPPKDSFISAEPERAVIRLGEELVIRGSIAGTESRDTYTVQLKENGKKVKGAVFSKDESRWFQITHKPEKAGKYDYALELVGQDSLAGNNASTFKARVVNERIKVFMMEGFPRFDFKLVKAALEVDPMIELVTLCHIPGGGVYVQGEPLHANPEQGLITSQSELFKYDVVVLRDVPRIYFRAGGDVSESRLINIVEFVNKRGGGLIVLGGQDVFRGGKYQDSALAPILPFDLSDHYSKDDQFGGKYFVNVPKAAFSHPIMRLFPESGRNRERWNSLRELDGSNNVGRFKPLATPLLTRYVKIKDAKGEVDEKEVPVMGYHAAGEGKVVAAAVDTLWRWQLQPEFDDPPLQALLANMVRYLAPDPQSKPGSPSVSLYDATPQVGQEAVLFTDLRDKNYDPIRNAELRVTVLRPDGKEFRLYPRDLPEQPGHYEYRVPLELPGAYEVSAEYGKQKFSSSFMAGASGSEFADLSADREAMAKLAEASGGTVIGSLDDWLTRVEASASTREARRELQVWNSPLVLILFLLLVSLDCYVRKRQGLA